ncbi:MAG TPA: TolC family protein [Bacteroidales bacterium]|nr:TolC family protein [Bacteroidales bacterium]
MNNIIYNTARLTVLLFMLFIISAINLNAQKVLSLTECYESANKINALSTEKNMYSDISTLKEKNIATGWLPSLDLSGSIVYNSDVADMGNVLKSLPFPGVADAISPLPHDQYKITLEINQVIYDGGTIKGARELEKSDKKVNEKQTESDLYKLRSQINTYYYSILLLNRQKELLSNYLQVIEKRLKSINSGIENGVVSKSDADVITTEKINLLQQLSENSIKKNTLLIVLSSITGIDIPEKAEFTVPEISINAETELNRPELALFDLKKEQLSAGEQLINSKRMPKAFGFATLGYGNPPGSNFFADEFDTYYIIGGGIKWNIFDWNKAKNDKQVISIQKNIIENRKKDLEDNLTRQLRIKQSEIQTLEKLATDDAELINLRKRITASAESQYDNGVITATEYLNILNSEKQTLINSEIHKVNLALAKTDYLNISGKELQ